MSKEKGNSNLLLGLLLLVGAGLIITSGMGLIGDLNVFTVIATVILVYVLIKSLFKLRFSGILFPLAFLGILYDKMLGIEELTPFPILFAALLGSIGLHLIFKPKKSDFFHKRSHVENKETSEEFSCKNTFGEVTKYVASSNLKYSHLQSSFGEMNIYFENAKLSEEGAEIYVDGAFGEMNIYIPADWNVVTNISCAFGEVHEPGSTNIVNGPIVQFTGSFSFGECNIRRI